MMALCSTRRIEKGLSRQMGYCRPEERRHVLYRWDLAQANITEPCRHEINENIQSRFFHHSLMTYQSLTASKEIPCVRICRVRFWLMDHQHGTSVPRLVLCRLPRPQGTLETDSISTSFTAAKAGVLVHRQHHCYRRDRLRKMLRCSVKGKVGSKMSD